MAGQSTRPVLVDPNQLELAILNLALNARDAMPNGGAVTLSFDQIEIAGSHDLGLEPGGYLRLRVRDTGSGMDEATLKRAIEPFFSTKGVGKGTGLGLSMIHGLAVQSGGALRLVERGRGRHHSGAVSAGDDGNAVAERSPERSSVTSALHRQRCCWSMMTH